MSPAGTLMPSQLVAIAQCESGLQQYYPNGELVVNTQSGAMGIFQEMPFHQTLANKMGLDLTQAKDNIEYGVWLYNKFGTAPWLASEPCWGKTEVAVASP